ncbi:S8 family serine peptidase [Paenibacillus sp. HJL G12]|uniref:S8 family serine peptidase n=1 Tax=Paenibacillus dendrobii TaxID=2691084 RepID=A0A7X3INY6_9BACL|nr:S8 family serine peptidase [Paenibacillus dendrobii]MWV47409.1 S8 family serine peptidase [Paenibacillus dendrobii]
MKARNIKHWVSGALAATLVASSVLATPIYAASPAGLTGIDQAKAQAILDSLSPEQRKALEQLTAKPSNTIDPSINTEDSKLTNIIVEFKQSPAAVAVLNKSLLGRSLSRSTAESLVSQSHEQFKAFINKLKVTKSEQAFAANLITINREYTDAMNGVSMTLPGTAVKELLKSGLVKKIWKDGIIKLPEEQLKINTSDGSSTNELKGTQGVAGISTRMADSVPYIGVDKLHEENITGKGVKVGVLDTGIDYNHPDLTGAYKGYRAAAGVDPKSIDPASVKGWDFIDNDADPMETTMQDWIDAGKPGLGEDYATAHGTHVSGTIAGQKNNNVDYAVMGIAPDADLYVYRVLGPSGSGEDSGVIAGIDKAIKDDMDVINLSLGSKVNDPLNPSSVAINNAMLQGVVSVIAAGNDGPNAGTLGSPGASALAITVGASDVPVSVPTVTASVYSADLGGAQPPIIDPEDETELPPATSEPGSESEQTFASDQAIETEQLSVSNAVYGLKLFAKDFKDQIGDLQGKEFEVVYAGLGYEEDFADIDVTGKIALISRGELAFVDKIANAVKAGAAAIIIYNNTDGLVPDYLGEHSNFIPTFQMLKADGEGIKNMKNPSLKFENVDQSVSGGDQLADFSSRGPVAGTNDIKPDLVAPGVSVFSTYPVFMNDPEHASNYDIAYTRMSGTSMATPHVAGIAALILQQHPDYTPFDVKTALMNTSVDLKKEYSVHEVGAGRVDAYRAVHADTSVRVLDSTLNVENDQYVEVEDITGSMNFGSLYTENGASSSASKNLRIENRGTDTKTYLLSTKYKPANGSLSLDVPASITLSPGESKDFTAVLNVSDQTLNSRYEGYLQLVNSSNSEDKFQLPFVARVTDKGIDFIQMDPPSVTNDTPYHQFYSLFTLLEFNLKSPMEYFDIILKDSSGNALGTLGTFDAVGTQPGLDYYIPNGFKGYVYPFTDNGVAETARFVPEGTYTLEMIANDSEGTTYTKNNVVVVDNQGPDIQMTLNDQPLTPSVVEVDDSMLTDETLDGKTIHGVWVHGSVHDDSVDILNQAGYDLKQNSSTVAYYEYDLPMYSGFLKIEDNGSFRFGVTPEEYETEPYQLRLFGFDMASAASPVTGNKLTFIKKGSTYATNSFDKKSVQLGDSITMTLNVTNATQFAGGKFVVENDFLDNLVLDSVKVNPAFQALAESKGATVDVKEPEETEYSTAFEANLSGENFAGLEGSFPFLDVTYKVVDDSFYYKKKNINVTDFSTHQVNESDPVVTPVFNLEDFDFISKHSRLYGYIGPEAFLVNGEFLDAQKYDFSKIKIEVYAESESGERYEATVGETGEYNITGIPATDRPLKVYMKTPGHTTLFRQIALSKEVNGELYGVQSGLNLGISVAGDINGDQVVDIYDMELAAADYGSSNPRSDINQDGIVNDTDVNFIINNFMQAGENSDPAIVPQEKIGNKDLNYFLNQIKIHGNNNNGGGSTSGSTSPILTPSTGTTITADQLSKATNGKVSIAVSPDKDIKLPVNAGELLKDNVLELHSDQVSVVIPSSVLKALTKAAGAEAANGSIVFRFAPDEQMKAGTPSEQGLSLKMAGTAYGLELYFKKSTGEKVVLPSFPEQVQVTISYPEQGLQSTLLGLYYWNEKSGQWEYVGGDVDAASHKVQASLSHFSKYAILEYNKSFSDLGAIHWANKAVTELAAKHIVSGQSEVLFAPKAQTTRAEFASFIARALKLDTSAASVPFTDVKSDAWYSGAVAAAYKAGLIQGVSEASFAPNKPITREEMAVLAVRAYEWSHKSNTASNDAAFTDASSISAWAVASVGKSSNLGIMQGQKNGQFIPKASASRAETAQTIYNLLKALQ